MRQAAASLMLFTYQRPSMSVERGREGWREGKDGGVEGREGRREGREVKVEVEEGQESSLMFHVHITKCLWYMHM